MKKNIASTICNHQFNFLSLIESLFNDKRCPICRYQLDFKQVNIGFDIEIDKFIKIINELINKNDNVVIVSNYDNLLSFLKYKFVGKTISLISNINIQKVIKFNDNEKKFYYYPGNFF